MFKDVHLKCSSFRKICLFAFLLRFRWYWYDSNICTLNDKLQLGLHQYVRGVSQFLHELMYKLEMHDMHFAFFTSLVNFLHFWSSYTVCSTESISTTWSLAFHWPAYLPKLHANLPDRKRHASVEKLAYWFLNFVVELH